jgi:hypothetical protein
MAFPVCKRPFGNGSRIASPVGAWATSNLAADICATLRSDPRGRHRNLAVTGFHALLEADAPFSHTVLQYPRTRDRAAPWFDSAVLEMKLWDLTVVDAVEARIGGRMLEIWSPSPDFPPSDAATRYDATGQDPLHAPLTLAHWR